MGDVTNEDAAADAVFVVGEIETFDDAVSGVSVVAVANGRVIAVGGSEVIEAYAGQHTDIHRYDDAVLLPGLTDGHFHPIWGTIEMARGVDLTDVSPLEKVIAKLQDGAANQGPDEWVLGWGLDPNVFEAPMNGRMLKDALENRPVALRMRDAHSLIVSPRAIEVAGLTGKENFADQSSVESHHDGMPSGLILELSAMAMIEKVIPQESLAQQAARVLAELTRMSTLGLTGGHAMDFFAPSEEVLLEIERRTELPMKLRFSPMCLADSTIDDWRAIAALQGTHGRRWTVEGVKFMLDGTVDNGTAWLETPDTYGESRVSIWTDPERYLDALKFFVQQGIPTATHAIGDRAVRFALEGLASTGEDLRQTPHRIEHIESIPDETVDLFAELGVIASMQPIHGTHHTRADRTDNWSVRLGEERSVRGWRCRDFRDRGVVLALGSDWPVTPVDPRAMMADAQLRRPVGRPDVSPVQPEQGLTARMAHEGYTTHAALAAGHPETRGKVAPGFDADFTIFARNPLDLAPEQQAANQIIATVVDGMLQYQALEQEGRM
jgi:predicted amidohydrolase YtcJ